MGKMQFIRAVLILFLLSFGIYADDSFQKNKAHLEFSLGHTRFFLQGGNLFWKQPDENILRKSNGRIKAIEPPYLIIGNQVFYLAVLHSKPSKAYLVPVKQFAVTKLPGYETAHPRDKKVTIKAVSSAGLVIVEFLGERFLFKVIQSNIVRPAFKRVLLPERAEPKSIVGKYVSVESGELIKFSSRDEEISRYSHYDLYSVDGRNLNKITNNFKVGKFSETGVVEVRSEVSSLGVVDPETRVLHHVHDFPEDVRDKKYISAISGNLVRLNSGKVFYVVKDPQGYRAQYVDFIARRASQIDSFMGKSYAVTSVWNEDRYQNAVEKGSKPFSVVEIDPARADWEDRILTSETNWFNESESMQLGNHIAPLKEYFLGKICISTLSGLGQNKKLFSR